jgi:hypothetical protein
MNHYNKKYNLKEGRVIGNNIINYGGFPKNINEANDPIPNNIQQVSPDTASPPLPPGNQPEGVDFPTAYPTYPETVAWWEAWLAANPAPRPYEGESRKAYLIRRDAYDALFEAYQQWRLRLSKWYRDQMYPPG